VLLPGELGLALELTVRDKRGKVTEHRVLKSESFVRQFLELLYVQMTYQPDGIMSVRDTTNNLRDVKSYLSTGTANINVIFDMAAVANDTNYGILVGTGNTAPTINDYMIETLIAHGVGAGQLQYGLVAFGAPASDATTSQITVTRDFANGSGGAITVNEIGLVCRAPYGPATSIEYFLIVRDVIGGGINVPNGQTLTVNYRPQATI
jgi:hypothetical protein